MLLHITTNGPKFQACKDIKTRNSHTHEKQYDKSSLCLYVRMLK